MVSTWAQKCSGPTSSPHSSSSSRRAACLAGLAEFLRAAGQRPAAEVRWLAALAQQHLVVLDHHDADADDRPGGIFAIGHVFSASGAGRGVGAGFAGSGAFRSSMRRHQRFLLPGTDLIRPAGERRVQLVRLRLRLVGRRRRPRSAPRHPCQRGTAGSVTASPSAVVNTACPASVPRRLRVGLHRPGSVSSSSARATSSTCSLPASDDRPAAVSANLPSPGRMPAC